METKNIMSEVTKKNWVKPTVVIIHKKEILGRSGKGSDNNGNNPSTGAS